MQPAELKPALPAIRFVELHQRDPNSPVAPAHRRQDTGNGFEPLLDCIEAAALLRMHPKTLRTKARRGIVPAIHVGKLWRFRVSALNEWLEKKQAECLDC